MNENFYQWMINDENFLNKGAQNGQKWPKIPKKGGPRGAALSIGWFGQFFGFEPEKGPFLGFLGGPGDFGGPGGPPKKA